MDENREQMAEFSAPVRNWFADTFGEPTRVQCEAWRTIAEGSNALVIAPTGSGKTLAAFLWAIDRLAVRGTSGHGGDDGCSGSGGAVLGEFTGPNRQDNATSRHGKETKRASTVTGRKSRLASVRAGNNASAASQGKSPGKVRVLYVSPLKALGVDVHKNLQVPLAGIQVEYAESGRPIPMISTGVRSGDTTASERRRLA